MKVFFNILLFLSYAGKITEITRLHKRQIDCIYPDYTGTDCGENDTWTFLHVVCNPVYICFKSLLSNLVVDRNWPFFVPIMGVYKMSIE